MDNYMPWCPIDNYRVWRRYGYWCNFHCGPSDGICVASSPGRNTHFWEINISVKTAEFVICVQNLWICTVNEEILKNLISIFAQFSISADGRTWWPVNDEPSNKFARFEIVFQEQSYSRLHSGRSLAWDHIRGDINDPCGIIADFCGVIADPCGVVVISEAVAGAAMPIVARLTKHRKTLLNVVKHHETHLEFFFQEQSYSSLHSGRSLAWDHVRGDIDNPFSN